MTPPASFYCRSVGLTLILGSLLFLWWKQPEAPFVSFGFFIGLSICLCGCAAFSLRRKPLALAGFLTLVGIGLSVLIRSRFGLTGGGSLAGALLGAGLCGVLLPSIARWAAAGRHRPLFLTGSAILSLIAAPYAAMLFWLGGGLLLGKLDEWRYRPTSDFHSSRWRTNRKYRFAVLDHTATKVISPGQTADEVIALLGEPDTKPNDQEWQYETQRPGFRFIDFSGGGLVIRFTLEGRVDRASTNPWVD